VKRFILIFSLLFMQNNSPASETENLNEYRIATAMYSIVQSTRKIYTAEISDKLFQDGTGSLLEYKSHKGFVPLPIQIIQKIGKDLSRSTGGNISIALKSKYFVNEINRLEGNERQAWDYLERQQNSTKNIANMTWKPYSYIDKNDSGDSLVFIAADIATEESCVSCHETQEHMASVKYNRKKYGVIGKPNLKLWHMLGIVKISVKLKK